MTRPRAAASERRPTRCRRSNGPAAELAAEGPRRSRHPARRCVELVFYPGELEDIERWQAAREAARQDDDPAHDDWSEYQKTFDPDGVGKLYVKVGGNIVDEIDCRGGPAVWLKDRGTHWATPSKAGTYHLGDMQAHQTSAWATSQIRWGAEIRQRDDGEIEYREPGEKRWHIATGPKSKLAAKMEREWFYDENGDLMSEWRENDFGPHAWAIEGSPSLYVHTTPDDETTTLDGDDPVLAASHGCLHVKPADRDYLMKQGFLRGGVKLTIKKYTAHLLPKAMRETMETTAS